MNTGKKLTNAVKLFIAIMTGDDAEAKGLRVISKADSILTAELAQLSYKKHQLVDNLERAEENAKNALVNFGYAEVDREDYLSKLYETENTITIAKEALGTHEKLVEFITRKQNELQK